MNFYGNTIINAVRQTVGTSVGGVSLGSRPEGHPLDWLDSTKYPALFIVPSLSFPDMGDWDQQGPKYVEQEYSLLIYYVMSRGTSGNPWETVRTRGEEIANKLDLASGDSFTGFTLTGNDAWVASAVTHVSVESKVQQFFREQSLPYASCEIGFHVVLQVELN